MRPKFCIRLICQHEMRGWHLSPMSELVKSEIIFKEYVEGTINAAETDEFAVIPPIGGG